MTKPSGQSYRPEMRQPLLDALAAGATYRSACGAAGIPLRTWWDWCKAVDRGQCANAAVVALVADARKTYHQVTNAHVARVAVAGAKDWRASAWLVEKRELAQQRRYETKRAKHEAEIAKNRAAGTHVENVRQVESMTTAELEAEARKILGLDTEPHTEH
jgi:hypothetical protein